MEHIEHSLQEHTACVKLYGALEHIAFTLNFLVDNDESLHLTIYIDSRKKYMGQVRQ